MPNCTQRAPGGQGFIHADAPTARPTACRVARVWGGQLMTGAATLQILLVIVGVGRLLNNGLGASPALGAAPHTRLLLPTVTQT